MAQLEDQIPRVHAGRYSAAADPGDLDQGKALPKESFYSHRALARCLEVKEQQKTVSTVFGTFPLETVETVSQTWNGFTPG